MFEKHTIRTIEPCAEQQERGGDVMAAKTIILFNHKGGVSKTTTTYHIAWKLTEMGRKVLLIDGDPQCNLSYLILGEAFDRYYEDKATEGNNIYNGVKDAFDGKPRPIQAAKCFLPENNQRLFLIPGHPNLSEYDPALSFALNASNAITTLQNLPGSFAELAGLTVKKYGIDYVFIDMNPGLSSLNRTFFMMTDAFIVPTNPDPFSVMAMKTLKNILPKWKSWSKNMREYFADATYALPDKEMKFIGEIIQRFTIRKGSAARPFQNRISEIREYVEKELVVEFGKYDMCHDIDAFIQDGSLSDRCVAEISEFGSLLQKSHDAGVPVFALTDEQIRESGNVLEQLREKRDHIRDTFALLAKIVESV